MCRKQKSPGREQGKGMKVQRLPSWLRTVIEDVDKSIVRLQAETQVKEPQKGRRTMHACR